MQAVRGLFHLEALRSQPVEMSGERYWPIAGILRLLFAHHVDHLDATQDHPDTVSGLEAGHRSHAAFDRAVILLNEVVEILALPDPDRLRLAS
jgi:hypothetical protein